MLMNLGGRKIKSLNYNIAKKKKLARNKGEEFFTTKERLLQAKTTGPKYSCRNKCINNFLNKNRKSNNTIGNQQMKKIPLDLYARFH